MGKMENVEKLQTRTKQHAEDLAETIENIAQEHQTNNTDATLVASVFMKKERFLKPQNFTFCYQENFGQLINKLTIMEARVALSMVRLCEFGNMINIQKKLVAEVACIHATHIAKVYKGLIDKGFLIEKAGAVIAMNGEPVEQKTLFINPVFYSKGQTEMFVGKKREVEGITMEEGERVAKIRSKIDVYKVVVEDKKLEKAARKHAEKQAQQAIEKIKDAVAEIDPRQKTIFEELTEEQKIIDAIKENIDEGIEW